jgi:RHS repeat-associated protein
MAKKTHPHKRSSVRKAAERKPSAVAAWTHRSRNKIALAVIASALLTTAALAYWKAPDNELVTPPLVTSEAANKSPVKDVPTLSEKELADIPPEAFHPQPPMPAGYNAHNGGLPPGALPPGVVLPGMPAMQGGRTTAQGYGMADGVRQQFTSKERDNETGLDYFGARYYSSAQGRFTSPDPQNIIFEKDQGRNAEEREQILKRYLLQPQNWNKYTYTRNNPLAYTDPNGRCSAPAGLSKGNVGICIEAFIASSTFMGIGKGDNRDFAANDPDKSFRVQVQGIFTRGHFDWSASLQPRPGVSEPRISFGYGLEGKVTADVTSKSVDKEGNFHVSLKITGTNGFSALTGIGDSEKIQINVNLVVTPGGKVGIERGSESTNYPSMGFYSYNLGSDGKPMSNVIVELRETKPSALGQPLVAIPAVPPSRCPESPGCIKQ